MFLNLLNQAFHIGAHLFSLPGPAKAARHTTQFSALFHQIGLIPLLSHAKGSLHPSHASAHHQDTLLHLQHDLLKGFNEGRLGYGHANQVLRLLRGLGRIVHMDPRVLIPDVGHLEEVLVEARIPNGLLE